MLLDLRLTRQGRQKPVAQVAIGHSSTTVCMAFRECTIPHTIRISFAASGDYFAIACRGDLVHVRQHRVWSSDGKRASDSGEAGLLISHFANDSGGRGCVAG